MRNKQNEIHRATKLLKEARLMDRRAKRLAGENKIESAQYCISAARRYRDAAMSRLQYWNITAIVKN